LHELLIGQPFAPYRAATVLELLRDYPDANIFRLGEMAERGAGDGRTPIDGLLTLRLRSSRKKVSVDLPQYDKWIAAAYNRRARRNSKERFDALARARPAAIF